MQQSSLALALNIATLAIEIAACASLTTSTSALAEDVSLSLRVAPSSPQSIDVVGIVNSGASTVVIKSLTLNKKRNDPSCFLTYYQIGVVNGKSTGVLASRTFYEIVKDTGFEPIADGVSLSTGDTLTVHAGGTESCGERVFVDIETDQGTLSWNLMEQQQ